MALSCQMRAKMMSVIKWRRNHLRRQLKIELSLPLPLCIHALALACATPTKEINLENSNDFRFPCVEMFRRSMLCLLNKLIAHAEVLLMSWILQLTASVAVTERRSIEHANDGTQVNSLHSHRANETLSQTLGIRLRWFSWFNYCFGNLFTTWRERTIIMQSAKIEIQTTFSMTFLFCLEIAEDGTAHCTFDGHMPDIAWIDSLNKQITNKLCSTEMYVFLTNFNWYWCIACIQWLLCCHRKLEQPTYNRQPDTSLLGKYILIFNRSSACRLNGSDIELLLNDLMR